MHPPQSNTILLCVMVSETDVKADGREKARILTQINNLRKMSRKTTRGTKPKVDAHASAPQKSVASIKKVFYVAESLLHRVEGEQRLRLERFHHPGKGKPTLFITLEQREECHIMELLEYSEPRRSWLISRDDVGEISSNGRFYITTPIDTTLLALHQLRKHCSQRAMSLDSIHDEEEASANSLLTKFVNASELKYIADVKSSGNTSYYKYNEERTMAWLAIKTRHVVVALKAGQVHCGHAAQSQNYVRSDKFTDENDVSEMDYMRMACDYVGRYLDADLQDQLVQYLEIPSEVQALVAESAKAQKRKSLQGQMMDANNTNKKVKLNNGDSLLDHSLENNISSPPLKERSLTSKEKALARGAKGTKSISSFFKIK